MGLYDRNYMYDAPDRGRDGGMGVLWALIAVNAVIYLLIAPPGSAVYRYLALHCTERDFHIFQLLTAGFLHYDFTHILFNMYGLYIFGKLVAPHLGRGRFLTLYLSGLLCSSALFLLLNWNTRIVLVGASGAICSVMMAAAMLEPDQRFVMLFMPFSPIKTSTLIACYTIIEILMTLLSSQSHVAHLAHLGGFVSGYLLMKLIRRGNVAWDPFRRKRKNLWQGSASAPPPSEDIRFADSPVSREELDALLDKISRSGINSLSPQELARLKQAREEMRR